MFKKILCLSLTAIVLTSCWDKVELEDRAFVISIGVDKFDAKRDKDVEVYEDNKNLNRFTVSVATPNLDVIVKDSGDENSAIVKTASNQTITGATKIIDSYSSDKIYFGQTKLAVFSEDLLKDPHLFKETVDSLERNPNLSRKLIVLATDMPASEVLSAKPQQQPMVGMFVQNYYANNPNASALSFRLDLSSLILSLNDSSDAIIPKITYVNEELKLGGASVIKNFELVGWLNDLETTGYLWMKGDAEGSVVIVPFEDTRIPLVVTKNKTKIKFEEKDDKLLCTAYVTVKGVIEEFSFSDDSLTDEDTLKKLSVLYEGLIEEEMNTTWTQFNKKYVVDGFNFKKHLRKHNYDLYLKYENDWDNALKNMELITDVNVAITGTGSKK
jgi:spore germination protein KC